MTAPMRAYVAGVQHESSRFSPVPTPLGAFGSSALAGPRGGRYSGGVDDDMGYGAFAVLAAADGMDVVAGPWSLVQPSRPASAATWETVRDAILGGLRAAGPVDVVFLMLHGAQVADGCDDCEGDLASRVRAVVGPDVAVGMLLDLHANLSSAMLDHTDLVVACREYPHTDYADRTAEMLPVLRGIREGRVRPATAAVRVPAPGVYPTTDEPMRSFVDRCAGLVDRGEVLAVSLIHGFEGADVPDVSAAVVVTTDGDPELADRLAWRVGGELLDLVTSHPWVGPGVAEAVDLAVDAVAATGGPVVVADRSDNPGGGAAGDATYLLGEVLARAGAGALERCAVALVWDPAAVEWCHAAGEGARLPLRIGGKAGRASGPPLDVAAEVLAVRRDARQAWFARGEATATLGRSAAVRVACGREATVDIVLNDERQQVFTPQVFTDHGIDPAAADLVVVKSAQHFLAGFADLARAIIRCDGPGTTSTDLTTFPFERIRRPMYPLDPAHDVRLEWLARAVRA